MADAPALTPQRLAVRLYKFERTLDVHLAEEDASLMLLEQKLKVFARGVEEIRIAR